MKMVEVSHAVNECWQNKILMKKYLKSLKHGFEMLLDGSIAKGSPKKKIKPYHKRFYKTQKNQDVISRGKVNFLQVINRKVKMS